MKEESLRAAGVNWLENSNSATIWTIYWYHSGPDVIADRILISADKGSFRVEEYDSATGDARWGASCRLRKDEPAIPQIARRVLGDGIDDESTRLHWQTVAPGRMRNLAIELLGYEAEELPEDII